MADAYHDFAKRIAFLAEIKMDRRRRHRT